MERLNKAHSEICESKVMPPAATATVATPAEVQVGTAMLIVGAIAWGAESAGCSMGSAIAECRIGMFGIAKPIVPLARSINAIECTRAYKIAPRGTERGCRGR